MMKNIRNDRTLVSVRKELAQLIPYSPGKPIWEVQEETGMTHVIKLASNENPNGASVKAIHAAVEAMGQLSRYPDASCLKLREAIALHYNLTSQQVIAGNGADELIALISQAFLEPLDEIIVLDPTFSAYESGAALMGAITVRVPLAADFSIDLEAIIRRINPRTKLIYICSPNNPTGTAMTRSDLEKLLSLTPKSVLVIYDGAYAHYATHSEYSDGTEFVRSGCTNLAVLQTFSKVYGLAGLRVGFLMAHCHIIDSVAKVKEPFNVNGTAQAAAMAAIHDQDHVKQSIMINELGRQYFAEQLQQLRVPFVPSSANFMLIRLGVQALEMSKQLERRGIIVRHAGMWGLPEHIRVSIGTEEENKLFIQALSELIDNFGDRPDLSAHS